MGDRVDIKAILLDPVRRRKLMVQSVAFIIATTWDLDMGTARARAELALDTTDAELHGNLWWTGPSPSDSIDARAVTKSEGVCGGRARLVGTRIPVWVIAVLARQGGSLEEIQRAYPSLSSDDVAVALAYANAFPEEIQTDICDQETDPR